MKVVETAFEGLIILEPEVFIDSRGYFFESFNNRQFSKLGLPLQFVQENQSRSKKNVIRGLHFQKPPMAQSKLVWVAQGTVRDVVVDLRKGQPTYGKWHATELSSENLRRLFVPAGFAHGFSVLSEYADFCYLCDEYYSPHHQAGIHFKDPVLHIDWGINDSDCILSEKDNKLPSLEEAIR